MLRAIQIKKDNPPSANLSRYGCMKAVQQFYSNIKWISYSEEGMFLHFSHWTWSIFQLIGLIIKLCVCLPAMPLRHTDGPHTPYPQHQMEGSGQFLSFCSCSLSLSHSHVRAHTPMNQPTNHMKHDLYWEANSSQSSQETCCILRNLKVH